MRHNPFMTKYEAVPHKYEKYTEINIRELIPNPIPSSAYILWWYKSSSSEADMEV